MDNIKLEIVKPHTDMITPKYFPNWAKQSLLLIEECGRVSHRSEKRAKKGSAEPFIRKVAIDWGHESIIRHFGFTVCFVCSRAASHQVVRHQAGTVFTQSSQRYCDYSKKKHGGKLRVIIPPSIGELPEGTVINTNANGLVSIEGTEDQDVLNRNPNLVVYLASLLDDYELYKYLASQGIKVEDARYGLANATATEVYMTANYQAWRHFCRMRLDKHAQWEVKLLARQVFNNFKEHCPLLMENLRTHSGDPCEPVEVVDG